MFFSTRAARSQCGAFWLLAPYNAVAPESSLMEMLVGSYLGGGVFWHDGGHEFF